MGAFRPVKFSIARMLQAGAFHQSNLRTSDCLSLVDGRQSLSPTNPKAAGKTYSVQHATNTPLIVSQCGDYLLIRGEWVCCELISLGYEIGQAEDQTHV